MGQDQEQADLSYECVEPDVGAQMWQYDMPGVAAEVQQQLVDHLTVCAECRLQLGVRRHLEKSPVEVEMPARSRLWAPERRRTLARGLGVAAVLNLAACLLLTFLLPPRDPDADRRVRSGVAQPHFVRPVTEEVVHGSDVDFRWIAVEHASAYRLRLRDLAGEFEWSTETREPATTLPAEVRLPVGTRLHAYLETIPPYLTPDEGIAVSFRTGTLTEFAAYRIGVNRMWVWLLGGLGLVFAAVGILLKEKADPARAVL